MKTLWELFLVFAKVGGLTFGGGYAMMPLLQKEVIEGKHWATEQEIMDYYAIGQCTPGIIAVNTSIFIGYKVLGLAGAIAAAAGVIAPSVVIIIIIAMFLQNIMDIAVVQNAFTGIRIAVCALVLHAAVGLWKKGVVDKATGVIFLMVLALLLFTPISPIPVIVFSAVVGILLRRFSTKKGGEAECSISSFSSNSAR